MIKNEWVVDNMMDNGLTGGNGSRDAGQLTERLVLYERRLELLEQELARVRGRARIMDQLARDETISSALTPSGFTLPRQGTVNTKPGASTAGASYTATEQTMLQAAYDLVRQYHDILLKANLAST